MSNNIFDQCTFFLSQVSNKSTVSKLIKDNGGQIVFMVTKNVTHFITNDKEFQLSTFNVKKAQNFAIHIVSEEFIEESVKQNSRLPESNFTFTALPKPKQFSYFDSPSKSPIKNDSSSSFSSTNDKPVSTRESSSIFSSSSSSSSSSSYSSLSSSSSFSTTTKPSAKKPTERKTTKSYTSPLESSITIASPFSSAINKPVIEIKKNPSKVSIRLYNISDKDQPEFNQSFEVLLSKTLQFSNFSGSSSNNKFYHIELQKDINNKHRVYTSYGRSDGKRTNEVRYCKDLNESIDVFSTIYNEKTSDKKGYKEVDLVSSSVASSSTSASFLLNSSSNSTLPTPISKLIEHLYTEATTQLTNSNSVKITEKGLETPLGVLSLDQIEKGEKVLYKIKNLLESSSGGSNKDFEALSSEFYTIIPQSMGRGKGATDYVISKLNQLNQKFELLQLMKDLLVIKDVGATLGSGTSATDMKYYALKNKISVLSQFDQDYSAIKKMANETKGVSILNIYKLDREGETPSYSLAPSPTKLLLHGSRSSNIVGILSRGMLLPKVITDTGVTSRTDFGYLGYGIYYGNSFETTCKYAHPSTTDGGINKRYAIVSRVALGKTYSATQINSKLTEPPSGFDSCLGLKRSSVQKSDFHDDEYVIYDSKRQRQEYLVEFTFSGTLPSSSDTFSTPSVTTSPVLAPSSSSFVKSLPTTTPLSAFSNTKTTTKVVKNTSPSIEAPKLINPTKPSTSFISSFSNLSISSSSNEPVDKEEDNYRKMFVNDRNNPKLSNKFLHCQKVFETKLVGNYKDDAETRRDLIMGYNLEKKEFVKSQNEFNEKWNKFTGNYFEGFNWDNTFVAGGSILGCSLENVGDLYSKSDIDIFLYGLSESEANRKLESIENFIKTKSPKSQMARTKYAVTFLNDAPLRNIQIVLRIYKSPAEVLMGFDIDCCSIGFDGSNVYAIPRAINSILNGYNIVSMSRRSLTYETRLFKYALRNFAIKVPNFNRDQIPTQIYQNDIKGSTGLLKLLLLEHKFSTKKYAIQFFINNSDSDYNSIEIPSGPYLTVNSAVSFINYKEKSQFFAKKKDGFKHCHMVVVGENAKDGKASWCKKCQAGEKPQDSSTQDVVHGPIQWVTENPGAQILTGSFHPVSDDKWFDLPVKSFTIADFKKKIIKNQDVSNIIDFSPKYYGATPTLLVDSNHLLCIAAAFGSNISMRSMMPIYKFYINTADEFGYYPIHYAVKSGNLECVNILLENNCLIPARSSSYGITSGMVATWYGNSEEYLVLANKCPRIAKIKSRTYPARTVRQWYRFPSIHSNPPSSVFAGNLDSSPSKIWYSILSGNTLLVKTILGSPLFKEVTDPLGNSLFHYAILSSRPKDMVAILKEYGYLPNRSNIFGQSVYDFAKAVSGNLDSWLVEKSKYDNIPQSISLAPSYLMNQIKQLLKELPNNSNDVITHSLPIEYIYNFIEKDKKAAVLPTSTSTQSFSFSNNAGSNVPPMPFGFGGKFSPQTTTPISSISKAPITTGPPPSSSFGYTGFGNTGFGHTGFNQKQASPPLSPSQFVVIPSSNQPPSLSLSSSPHQYQLPQSLPIPGNSMEEIRTALSVPKNVDIKSPEFLQSSRVAQILSLLDQFTTQGFLSQDKSLRIKNLLFDIHLPIFNTFESYYLYPNIQTLVSNLDLVLSKQIENKSFN